MPLKGTREARGKPPRRGAWLRDHMASSSEADFNLRGSAPLPHLARRGSRCVDGIQFFCRTLRDSTQSRYCQKDGTGRPDIPCAHRGACNSRYRLVDNRRLSDLVESITVNMGDLPDDVNGSGSREVATPPKSSDASGRSQRGHSTRSAGKPRTWGRATASSVLRSNITECEHGGSSVDVGEMQKKLSRWAEEDMSKRFYDLFDLLHQDE
jgi:hypothetical protein